jgi:outer membrane lipoprotein
MTRLLPLIAIALVSGCVSAPKALQGAFAPIAPADAVRAGTTGDAVRWGGRIVKVEPQSAQTCFEVVGVRLATDARPMNRDQSSGRFIACRGGFYDPEIFQPGREITFSGRVVGYEDRKVGEYDYRYPRMDADVVYLWPERRDVDVIVERHPFWW